MKHNRVWTPAIAAVLGFCLAFGAVGGLLAGFRLPLDSVPRFALLTAAVALLSAIGFSLKRGVRWVIGVSVVAAVLLCVFTDTVQELQTLLSRISYEYDYYYHWGYFDFGEPVRFFVTYDRAAALLAAVIAVTATGTVCRQRRAWATVIVAIVPLLACVVLTHTAPSQGYLFFLFTGLVLLLLTSALRRKDAREANRLFAIAAVPVVLVMLFLVGVHSPDEYENREGEWRDRVLAWLDASGSNAGEGNGGGKGVLPDAHLELDVLGPRTLQHVSIGDIVCSLDGDLYLREQHYDTYNGKRWSISDTDFVPYTNTLGGEPATVTVDIDSSRGKLLMPYYAQRYWPDGEEVGKMASNLMGGHLAHKGILYEYDWLFDTIPEGWEATLTQGEPTLSHGKEGTVLPAPTEEWANAFVAEHFTGGERSVTELAQTIAAFVASHGAYDDQTAGMPADEMDFVRWFMEESDTGYCIHYASAGAVLMRAAGIETRLVTGYLCAVKNGTGEIYADDAHAWVEYYEPQLGMWIPVECTPPIPEAEETTTTTVVTTTRDLNIDSVTTHPSGVTTTTTAPQSGAVAEDEEPTFPWGVLAVVGGVSVAAFVLWLQRMLRRRALARRMDCPQLNARALAVWQEIARCARLTGEPPDEEIYALAQKARFSQHTLTAEELEAMWHYHQDQLATLATHPWYKRFVYEWIWVI